MKIYRLPVLVEVDEDGIFIVSCPLYKACHSYGKTIDEAMPNLREVVEMFMEEEKQTTVNQFVGVREMQFIINAPAWASIFPISTVKTLINSSKNGF